MKLLLQSFDTPSENLAFEEWYFQNFKEETLRLWVSPKSVIIGKHQNALAEANYYNCKALEIPILRRISGGGTVYHDFGNINFSFFRYAPKNQVNYAENLSLINGVLKRLGYDIQTNARHDLLINGSKISGNAQHVSKEKSLHHGTILYDVDLKALSKTLIPTSSQYFDHSVKSVRTEVINLRSVKDLGSSNNFKTKLADALSLVEISSINPPENEFNKLVKKYTEDGWNIGYGPGYQFKSIDSNFKLELNVLRGGLITSIAAEFKGNSLELTDILNTKHFPSSISNSIESLSLDKEAKTMLKRSIF